ncbi:MAG: transcriptional regulator [Bacteroidia bacterium]|jgi:hypothetical protein|nr:transcriptional regulator [Bacteroidia bacterium]
MSANSKVNFIQHLLAISHKFIADKRLSPWHISLYYALFQSWNLAKFNNPVSISRSELMGASKIGSANTYTKCLRELDAWGYLKYNPSYNPHLGSLVYMYTFDKGSDKGSDKGTGHGSDNGSDKAPVIAVIPYINSINNTNIINKRKRENNHSLTNKTSYEKSKKKIPSPVKTKIQRSGKKTDISEKKEKFREKKKKDPATIDWSHRAKSRCKRPLLQQVLNYFKEKAWPEIEAQKYFNHYQSNGWLVGGKTPMNDWQASAEKWMLNSSAFKKPIVTPRPTEKLTPDNLNTTTNKNYNEPL